jgi:hypothetical protein
MLFRLLESNDCETAAGHPGRAVIFLLIVAALVVVATSVVIAVEGLSREPVFAESTAAVIGTSTGQPAPNLLDKSSSPARQSVRGETGFAGDLRD